MSVLALCLSFGSYAQEKAPLKNFEFAISINKLKTEDQAKKIESEVSDIPGVKNSELVLVDYELTFECTNHALNDYLILDRVKEIIISNGSEIITINRREK